jgi:CRP-like cAMP-binding protein
MDDCCKKGFFESMTCCLSLSHEELAAMQKIAVPKTLLKNEFFVKEGEVCDEFALICSGAMRGFYFTPRGETTHRIILPKMFAISLTSFLTGEPSVENIQAIEDTEIVSFSKSQWLKLSEFFPAYKDQWRRVFEAYYLNTEKHMYYLISKTADEHYEILCEQQPELVSQAPLKYVASLLGIDPVHLSRIRKKRRTRKKEGILS